MNEAYFLQKEMGGHRASFVPRSPAGSRSVSTPLLREMVLLAEGTLPPK